MNSRCTNYTIGYQPYQVDSLLNFLLKQGIRQLIDTRCNPVSRRYGFHKTTLSKLCQKVGITYVHIPELGVPSAWRQDLTSEESFKTLFKRYDSEILDKQMSLLMELAKEIASQPSVLMCQERERIHCHRSRLANRLSQINGLPVVELNDLYANQVSLFN